MIQRDDHCYQTRNEILDDTVGPRIACPCRLLDIGWCGDQQRSISVSHGKEKKKTSEDK